MNWFDVDKKGLAEIVARKNKSFILFELLQNAFDCKGTREVTVTIEPMPGVPYAQIIVTDDDPDGFTNLAHSYTLFAPSEKKGDPGRRGRFNLGEKLVLALCKEAEIVSTTGAVRFDDDGRHTLRRRRARGSEFSAIVRLTREEIEEVKASAIVVNPPPGVTVHINGGVTVSAWDPIKTVTVDLPTEIANADGNIVKLSRRTSVAIFNVANTPGNEKGWLYEMGIPVCETGDSYHIDVAQKIPLNMDRDGVSASYLKAIRTIVVNAMHAELGPEEVKRPWVQAALEDARIEPAAVRAIMEKQHGKDAVAFDPSDIEGTYISQAKGATVVPGGSYSKEAWENIRKAEALPPAGQVTPSRPKDFADTDYLDEHDLTPAMRRFRSFTRDVIGHVLEMRTQRLTIVFLRSLGASTIADWSSEWDGATIRFNVAHPSMGEAWFEGPVRFDHVDLLVHELAHHGGHHLASGYHELMSKAAGKIAILALEQPTLFDLSAPSPRDIKARS